MCKDSTFFEKKSLDAIFTASFWYKIRYKKKRP